MQETKYIWHNGTFVPWQDATVHVLTHSLHYGSAVFEGIRVYETDRGPAVFRLKEHVQRLLYSAAAMRMEVPYSEEEIMQAIRDTIIKNGVSSCYVRPIVFYGYGNMGLKPRGARVEVAIAVWPWGSYLGDDPVRVMVSRFIRIDPKSSVTDAKISGHYANSILASLEAKENGYDEALLLDSEGNIAEGPGENFFMVKGNTIVTPPLGTILPGITRASVLELAQEHGYTTEERPLSLQEAQEADECFFTGTAAEVCPIAELDGKPLPHPFGPVTKTLKDAFHEVVQGKNKKHAEWLAEVSPAS